MSKKGNFKMVIRMHKTAQFVNHRKPIIWSLKIGIPLNHTFSCNLI